MSNWNCTLNEPVTSLYRTLKLYFIYDQYHIFGQRGALVLAIVFSSVYFGISFISTILNSFAVLFQTFFQENKSCFPAVLLATRLKLFSLPFNSYLGNHNIMYCINMFYTHIVMLYHIENIFFKFNLTLFLIVRYLCVCVFGFICEFVFLMSVRADSERHKKWIMQNIYVLERYDRNN